MPTYKTKDGVDRVLPGIGRTQGGLITTAIIIENPMFELVEEGEQVPAAPADVPVSHKPAVAAESPAEPATPEEIAMGVQNNKPQTEEQK